jgi:hypothetical protein
LYLLLLQLEGVNIQELTCCASLVLFQELSAFEETHGLLFQVRNADAILGKFDFCTDSLNLLIQLGNLAVKLGAAVFQTVRGFLESWSWRCRFGPAEKTKHMMD